MANSNMVYDELVTWATSNGFTISGVKTFAARDVYEREWQREIPCYYAQPEQIYVNVRIGLQGDKILVWYEGHSNIREGCRVYKTLKKAIQTITKTIECEGFEL